MLTDQQHPITPPPELVEQWYDAIDNSSTSWKQELATQAARWGADTELNECCHLLRQQGFDVIEDLRATRRPKPPSLAEQALLAIDTAVADNRISAEIARVTRAALERLKELENNG